MSAISEMQLFWRVVERGSFSAAAKELGLTPSAASRVVSKLEDRLGVRLIHRTTRRLSLTPEGETYHRRAADILSAIEDTEVEVSQGAHAPQGRLRVNSVAPFAHFYISEALPLFMARYPKVEVELAVTDRIVDLLADGADIAIRTGPVTDPSLVVRKFGQIERGIYASPDYLARRGAPSTPIELIQHDCIALQSMPLGNRWPFFIDGEVKAIDIGSRISVDDGIVVLQLALAGAGIMRLTNLTVCRAVREGRLVQLFKDCHVAEPTPLSAVYPVGRHRMLKVRVFIDFLTEQFSQSWWKQINSAALS